MSRIPRSWQIFHIMLCFSGVSNVFFIASYPICMRVASFVYHAAWLCLSIPVVVVYIHSVKWGRSIDNIVMHLSMIMHSSYLITLGTIYAINTLKADRTLKFLKKWCLFCVYGTICFVEENNKRYRRFQAALLVICAALTTWYVVANVHNVFVYDWSICGSTIFLSLNKTPWLLTVMCVNYHILCFLSAISVILTACHFAILTLTFAEEFVKLYRIICNRISSPPTDIRTWEQLRFRYESLVSLVCLHGQLATMLLGIIFLGIVVHLCFSLYHIIRVGHTETLSVLNVVSGIVVFSTIVVPSSVLENEVSAICIKHFQSYYIWRHFADDAFNCIYLNETFIYSCLCLYVHGNPTENWSFNNSDQVLITKTQSTWQ